MNVADTQPTTPTTVYIGLGGNLDDPAAHILCACSELAALPQSVLKACSSLYLTAPVGFADQPDFINAVAVLETRLSAAVLLGALSAIEARHGRRRSFRNAPRPLDLDILLYGDETSDDTVLTLPHPRMHERAFVLEPLLEIAPDCRIPGFGPARVCLDRLSERCRGIFAPASPSCRPSIVDSTIP